jgi:acetyl esterase
VSGADDNSSWLSLVADQEVEAPPLRTVEEIVEFRAHPSRDLSRHNIDLPEDVEIQEDFGLGEVMGTRVTAEVYTPSGPGPFPLMLYMHGGGWCLGKALYVRKLGMSFASLGHVVVNLDYALAPENPFPAALSQAVYAARWMTANAAELKGRDGAISIGGASAGANLAAAAIVSLAGEGSELADGGLGDVAVEFGSLLALYGIFNFPLLMEDPKSHSGGFAETMYNQAYLGPHWLTMHRDPLVSPALSDSLSSFPSTYLTIGSEDALLPQSLDMMRRLADADVPATLSVVAGLNHSFAYIPHKLPDAAAELSRMFAWLQKTNGATREQEART